MGQTRRTYLALTGATLAVAGCSGGDNSGDDDGGTAASDSEETNTDDSQDSGSQDQATDSGEAEIVVSDFGPESMALGEDDRWMFEFTNEGDGTGERTFVIYRTTTYGAEPDDTAEWGSDEYTFELAPGESQRVPSETFSFDEPGVAWFGIDERKPEYDIQIPGSRAPIITDGSLVSGWESFGDVEENAIESARVGDAIILAYRYWYYFQERINAFWTSRLYGPDDERVRLKNREDVQLLETVGWDTFEVADAFDTRGLEPGRYTAEVVFEDRLSEEVSDPYRFEFELE